MENNNLVRIIKSELTNFKNVKFGEIKYMNFSSVEKNAELSRNDIVGVYGQNGSGKTAMVEAMDILKCILMGNEIPFDNYSGIIDKGGKSKISTLFFVRKGASKYKVRYDACLQIDDVSNSINIASETITYWQRGATWNSERRLSLENCYYNSERLLEGDGVIYTSNKKNFFERMSYIKSLTNIAIYCAQNHNSMFFNNLIFKLQEKEKCEAGRDESIFFDLLCSLMNFGRCYFQVVKVNQLAAINSKNIIPINTHRENQNAIMQGCLPLFMDGNGRVPEKIFKELEVIIDAINIAIKSIIPNLQLEMEMVSEELDDNNNKMILVNIFSIRDGKKFLTKYESEGIKRIISLLHYLVSLYNDPKICLVVDELDSGIFEYLLGELLGVLNQEGKGQLIFTSHNLRIMEKLKKENIVCTTVNSNNRYIRLRGIEKTNNIRDFYLRALILGGQSEELYDELDLQSIGYAFRKACGDNKKNDINIKFSDELIKLLEEKQ